LLAVPLPPHRFSGPPLFFFHWTLAVARFAMRGFTPPFFRPFSLPFFFGVCFVLGPLLRVVKRCMAYSLTFCCTGTLFFLELLFSTDPFPALVPSFFFYLLLRGQVSPCTFCFGYPQSDVRSSGSRQPRSSKHLFLDHPSHPPLFLAFFSPARLSPQIPLGVVRV